MIQIEPITLQAYLNDQWQDIAVLSFSPEYHILQLTYLYNSSQLLQDNHYAVSLNLPISFFPQNASENGFTFLDDIIPAGASRRYWLQQLDIQKLPAQQQNYLLLKKGAIAPIGHLRVKQAVESFPKNIAPIHFQLNEVIDRHPDFLDYANQRGAMAGGATGAGGEAPKLLLRRTAENTIWIDNEQLDHHQDAYYLVKFPRGKREPIDCDILRTEFHYYQELNTLGFQTIQTDNMYLEEGERYPSLWLPRFDIVTNSQGKRERYAMESVYSLLEKGAGSLLDHETTLRSIIRKIEQSYLVQTGFQFDKQALVLEWVKRDLLNIAFGNSDNHGRNTAFLRNEQKIWLAPIYDFAPMKADPEGIPRTITWNSRSQPPLELGGEFHFECIAEALSDLCEPELLLNELKELARSLITLKSRLSTRGVPESILNYPAIAFDYLPEKLQRWKLI